VQTATVATQVPADPTIFLIGRPPMREFIGFMKTQTVEGKTAEMGELAEQWRSARAHLTQLASIEAGFADDPPTEALPASLAKLADEVMQDPVTRQSFGITQYEIRMVELDRLVVFQKHINLTYSGQLEAALGDSPSEEDLFRFALPIDGRYDPPPNPAPIHIGPEGQIWAMVSPSTDFRVLDTVLLDPSQVVGLSPNGRPTHLLATVVGYTSNLVSAARVGSRLILRNGSHRAYTLRKAGHTHAPVLILDIPSGEEEEHLPPEVQMQRDAYLKDPRPPVLRDYIDDDLHLVVHVPRRFKQLRVFATYEEGGAPGA
jgi:hypothetical protein